MSLFQRSQVPTGPSFTKSSMATKRIYLSKKKLYDFGRIVCLPDAEKRAKIRPRKSEIFWCTCYRQTQRQYAICLTLNLILNLLSVFFCSRSDISATVPNFGLKFNSKTISRSVTMCQLELNISSNRSFLKMYSMWGSPPPSGFSQKAKYVEFLNIFRVLSTLKVNNY